MTPDDIRAVEADCARLINLYALLNDEHRWDEVAALFAEDGWMTRPSAPDARIVGREAILAAFHARPPRVTAHFCANIVVVVEGNEAASASSAMLLFSGSIRPGGGPAMGDGQLPLVGRFHDRFILTEVGWRFASRRGSLCFGS